MTMSQPYRLCNQLFESDNVKLHCDITTLLYLMWVIGLFAVHKCTQYFRIFSYIFMFLPWIHEVNRVTTRLWHHFVNLCNVFYYMRYCIFLQCPVKPCCIVCPAIDVVACWNRYLGKPEIWEAALPTGPTGIPWDRSWKKKQWRRWKSLEPGSKPRGDGFYVEIPIAWYSMVKQENIILYHLRSWVLGIPNFGISPK